MAGYVVYGHPDLMVDPCFILWNTWSVFLRKSNFLDPRIAVGAETESQAFKMSQPQSAIVTGGSSGIGKAVAHKLASRGINVLVADINTTDGPKVSQDLKDKYGVESAFVKLDTAIEADVINMVDTAVKLWGRIDWACNCAGKAELFTEGEEDVNEKIFDE